MCHTQIVKLGGQPRLAINGFVAADERLLERPRRCTGASAAPAPAPKQHRRDPLLAQTGLWQVERGPLEFCY